MANNNESLNARIQREEEELKKLEEEHMKALSDGQEDEEEGNEEESGEEEENEEDPEEEGEGQGEEEDTNSADDDKLTKEELTFKKRYGDLRRKSQEDKKKFEDKIDELSNQIKELKASSTSSPDSATEEDVKAWMKKYPQIASIVEAVADKKAKDLFDTDVTDVKKSLQEIKKEKGELEIMKVHPDYTSIKSNDNFHDWAEEQPKWVQDALYAQTSDPMSVIRVIDLYKVDKGLDVRSKKRDALEAASAVNTKKKSDEPPANQKGKSFSESQVASMSLADYTKFEGDILKSQREGTFIYDISGKK